MKSQGHIIGLELAKIARKAGFNEITDHAHCFDTVKKGYYVNYDPDYFLNSDLWDKHYAAPTYEQLHSWLRTRNRIVLIDIANKLSLQPSYFAKVYTPDPIWSVIELENKIHRQYESAWEDGLKYALESL